MKTRLQRFLADCGVASRRESEAMILAGRVRVNGQVPRQMPVMVDPEQDIITVDDEKIGAEGVANEGLREQQKVYFLLNKPKGILVTASDPSDRKTVGELMTGVKERVFPVGRLDMDSRGALIMTNDGELANRLTHPRYGVEKTYVVEVDGRLSHEDLEKVKRGVWLGPARHGRSTHATGPATRTEGFRLKLIGRERGRTILELKLSEAKNSEIRRAMARIGHVVRDLNRVAIAGKVTTRGLEPGEHRPLSDAEVKWLFHASSPEFHNRERAATQAWFEAKEMEKERKRLTLESKTSAEPAAREARAETSKEREYRPRPPRKGKKPFVPPSGRNAGKMLGGNFIGRQRVERQNPGADASTKSAHPLGSDAIPDE